MCCVVEDDTDQLLAKCHYTVVPIVVHVDKNAGFPGVKSHAIDNL